MITDLRDWLQRVDDIGELLTVDEPVDPIEEMSAVTYLVAKQSPSPAVLFEAPLGYDAMMVLAQAITAAGSTDGARVRDALTNVKDFDGVTGKITINEKRNATKAAVVLKVNGKQNDYVATIAP